MCKGRNFILNTIIIIKKTQIHRLFHALAQDKSKKQTFIWFNFVSLRILITLSKNNKTYNLWRNHTFHLISKLLKSETLLLLPSQARQIRMLSKSRTTTVVSTLNSHHGELAQNRATSETKATLCNPQGHILEQNMLLSNSSELSLHIRVYQKSNKCGLKAQCPP